MALSMTGPIMRMLRTSFRTVQDTTELDPDIAGALIERIRLADEKILESAAMANNLSLKLSEIGWLQEMLVGGCATVLAKTTPTTLTLALTFRRVIYRRIQILVREVEATYHPVTHVRAAAEEGRRLAEEIVELDANILLERIELTNEVIEVADNNGADLDAVLEEIYVEINQVEYVFDEMYEESGPPFTADPLWSRAVESYVGGVIGALKTSSPTRSVLCSISECFAKELLELGLGAHLVGGGRPNRDSQIGQAEADQLQELFEDMDAEMPATTLHAEAKRNAPEGSWMQLLDLLVPFGGRFPTLPSCNSPVGSYFSHVGLQHYQVLNAFYRYSSIVRLESSACVGNSYSLDFHCQNSGNQQKPHCR